MGILEEMLAEESFRKELAVLARRRLLAGLEAQPSSIVQNIGGGSAPVQAGAGIAEQMASNPSPEMFDYLVDIQRRNTYDKETGDLIGWNKLVKRSRMPTDDDEDFKKKVLMGRQMGQKIYEE